jgi:hypothetical protein
MRNRIEEMVQRHGFKDEAEFHRLNASAKILNPLREIIYKKWQYDDGSKDGLLVVLQIFELLVELEKHPHIRDEDRLTYP